MNKTRLVFRNEIVTALSRKSFLITAVGLPALVVLIFLGVSILNDASPPAGQSSGPGGAAAQDLKAEGYVDHSGLITAIHPDVPPGVLRPYPDEDSAKQAMKQGEISAYYLIPADYLASGDLIYVNPDILPLSTGKQTWVMQGTIFANLLGNDMSLAERAGQVMNLETRALSAAAAATGDDDGLTFYVPYGTMMLFYFLILMTSTQLINSVGDEKKNRTMEVLLASLSPRQMLSGKILGLGVLGLLQAVIWIGAGLLLLKISGQPLKTPDFQLPPALALWGIVYFVLGYFLFASLLAGLGALAPSLKEATQASIIVIWPLFTPLFFFVHLIEHTLEPLATGLSLFPLTAPVAMMARLATGKVPLWQPLLAAGLLLATTWLVLRAVARMFRAQTLLSGQALTVRRYLGALLGRA